MGAVRTPPKLVTRSLVESSSGTVGSVDREKRIIHGTKILGKFSQNTHGLEGIEGTEYTDAALDKAITLYEGKKSYADHPSRTNPNTERATRDLVGIHRNVRREKDGLYSDFHYRSSHNYLADDAEQMPDALGFSHNSVGSGRIANRKYMVESIDKVRSIDLVTQPATTRGLYESEETMATKTVAEALKPLKLGAKIEKQLFEDFGMASDAALAAPPAAGEDTPDYRDHLGEAIKTVLADDSLDMAAKKAKIMAILKASDDTTKSDAPKSDSDSGGGDDTSKAEKTSMESLQAEIAELKRDKAITDLCESESFKPSKNQRKALALFESEDDRLEFITEAKAAEKPAEQPKTGPRSQSSRTLQESKKNDDKPADSKGWLTRLKSSTLN